MTKELFYSFHILIIILIASLLRLPLELVINNSSANNSLNELLSGVITKPLVVTALLLFIHKKGFLTFNGLAPSLSITQIWLLIIPVSITFLIASSNLETFKQTESSTLILFGLNAALTGALEELALRGTILPLMLRHFSKKEHSFFKAIFVTSFLFGIAHFIGLVRHPDSFYSILSQVIFAVGIGFFMAALLLRTKNIISPIIVHFLINFSGGISRLKENISNDTSPSEGFNPSSYIPVLVITLVLVLVSVYMLRNNGKEEWLWKTSCIKI